MVDIIIGFTCVLFGVVGLVVVSDGLFKQVAATVTEYWNWQITVARLRELN